MLKRVLTQSTVQEFLTTIHDNISDDVHEELCIINLYNLTNMNIKLNYIYRTLIISSPTQ